MELGFEFGEWEGEEMRQLETSLLHYGIALGYGFSMAPRTENAYRIALYCGLIFAELKPEFYERHEEPGWHGYEMIPHSILHVVYS